jgi:hypothetical protein
MVCRNLNAKHRKRPRCNQRSADIPKSMWRHHQSSASRTNV